MPPTRIWLSSQPLDGQLDALSKGSRAESRLLTADMITFPDSGLASLTELVDGVPLTQMPAGSFFILDLWPSGASGAGGSRSNVGGQTVNGGCGAGGGAHARRFFTRGELAAMLLAFSNAIPVLVGAETIGGLGRQGSNGAGSPGVAGLPSRFGNYWTFSGGIAQSGNVNAHNGGSAGGGTMGPGQDGFPTANTVPIGGPPGPGPSFFAALGTNTFTLDASGEGGGSGGTSLTATRTAGGAQDGGGGGGCGGAVANGNGAQGGASETGGGGGGGGGAVSTTPAAGNGGQGGARGVDPANNGRSGGGGTAGANSNGGKGPDQRDLNEGGAGGGGGGAALAASPGFDGGDGGFPGGGGGGGGSTQSGNAGNGGKGARGRGVLRGFY